MGSAQATLHNVHVGTGLDLSSGKPMAGPSYMSSTTDGDIGSTCSSSSRASSST